MSAAEQVKKQLLSNPNHYEPAEMTKPWNIIKDLGYICYVDKEAKSTRWELFSLKRTASGELDHVVKDSKQSLIDFLDSLSYQQNFYLVVPKTEKGIIIDYTTKRLKFRMSDMSRFMQLPFDFKPAKKLTNNVYYENNIKKVNTYTYPLKHSYTGKFQFTPKELEHITLFLKILKNVTGGNDEATYALHWFVRNYQTLTQAENCLVLCGESGSGKGVLFEIINALYSSSYVSKGSNKNNIFIKVENETLMNKLYYFADEVKNLQDYWESVKSYVANSTFQLKALYKGSKDYHNFANFIFMTNTQIGELPFTIPEQVDRRISCFESHNVLADNDWFDAEALKKSGFLTSNEFTDTIARFFSTFEYDFEIIRKPYDNEIRKEMLEGGLGATRGYAQALLSKNIGWFEKNGIHNIDWINADGSHAKNYSWFKHLQDIFSNGYISVKDMKNLFQFMFPHENYTPKVLASYGLISTSMTKTVHKWVNGKQTDEKETISFRGCKLSKSMKLTGAAINKKSKYPDILDLSYLNIKDTSTNMNNDYSEEEQDEIYEPEYYYYDDEDCF
jgi:energy-coupling factor transporter ATP-binding protein EcfA2